MSVAKISILRNLLSELRRNSSIKNTSENFLIRYIIDQYRRHQVTDRQYCKASEEMNFMAGTYLCYLRSSRLYDEINREFHGKGELSVKETADLVGFKLPHDRK